MTTLLSNPVVQGFISILTVLAMWRLANVLLDALADPTLVPRLKRRLRDWWRRR